MKENKCSATCLLVALILSVVALGSGNAWGHGLGWKVEQSDVITIRFTYDDDSPMMYGAVEVFAPDAEHEYQKGRSDENGYFVFRPNRLGTWVVTGSDGQGHALRASVDVTALDSAGSGTAATILQTGGATRPRIERIVLGLSLLLNLGLAAAWRLAKKKA